MAFQTLHVWCLLKFLSRRHYCGMLSQLLSVSQRWIWVRDGEVLGESTRVSIVNGIVKGADVYKLFLKELAPKHRKWHTCVCYESKLNTTLDVGLPHHYNLLLEIGVQFEECNALKRKVKSTCHSMDMFIHAAIEKCLGPKGWNPISSTNITHESMTYYIRYWKLFLIIGFACNWLTNIYFLHI